MNYSTHNDKEIDCNGTSLQGYIDVSYKELKRIFGKPTDGDGYKVDAEWVVELSNGDVATIYNYKDGKNYNGSVGTPKTKIRGWHVGGRTNLIVDKLVTLIKIKGGDLK
jgi:hypothetical protein